MDEKKKLGKIFQDSASKYLEKSFTLKTYGDDPDDPAQYSVKGSVCKYGKTVNVEVSFEKEELKPVYWRITDNVISLPTEQIGRIKLGRDVCISDPCYDRDVWCMEILHNVKPGLWNVEVSVGEIDSWGERVYVLALYHEDFLHEEKKSPDWKEYAILGVDSGQMSVFDDQYYRQDEKYEKDSEAAADVFYEKCCDITSTDERFGLYYADGEAIGVVTSSGHHARKYRYIFLSVDCFNCLNDQCNP